MAQLTMRTNNWRLAKNVMFHLDTVKLSTLKKKFGGFRLTGGLICRTPINDGKACQLAYSPRTQGGNGLPNKMAS